jgi:hypothetical protein
VNINLRALWARSLPCALPLRALLAFVREMKSRKKIVEFIHDFSHRTELAARFYRFLQSFFVFVSSETSSLVVNIGGL